MGNKNKMISRNNKIQKERPNLIVLIIGMGIMALLIIGMVQVEVISNLILNTIFPGEELPIIRDVLTAIMVGLVFYLLYYLRENLVYDTFFQKVATSLFSLIIYVIFFFIVYIIIRLANS